MSYAEELDAAIEEGWHAKGVFDADLASRESDPAQRTKFLRLLYERGFLAGCRHEAANHRRTLEALQAKR